MRKYIYITLLALPIIISLLDPSLCMARYADIDGADFVEDHGTNFSLTVINSIVNMIEWLTTAIGLPVAICFVAWRLIYVSFYFIAQKDVFEQMPSIAEPFTADLGPLPRRFDRSYLFKLMKKLLVRFGKSLFIVIMVWQLISFTMWCVTVVMGVAGV